MLVLFAHSFVGRAFFGAHVRRYAPLLRRLPPRCERKSLRNLTTINNEGAAEMQRPIFVVVLASKRDTRMCDFRVLRRGEKTRLLSLASTTQPGLLRLPVLLRRSKLPVFSLSRYTLYSTDDMKPVKLSSRAIQSIAKTVQSLRKRAPVLYTNRPTEKGCIARSGQNLLKRLPVLYTLAHPGRFRGAAQ